MTSQYCVMYEQLFLADKERCFKDTIGVWYGLSNDYTIARLYGIITPNRKIFVDYIEVY